VRNPEAIPARREGQLKKQTQFWNTKMNITCFDTKDYENRPAISVGKNKPNSKHVLSVVEWANRRKVRLMACHSCESRNPDSLMVLDSASMTVLETEYDLKKQSQFPGAKMSVTVFTTKDYVNITASGIRENKANLSPRDQTQLLSRIQRVDDGSQKAAVRQRMSRKKPYGTTIHWPDEAHILEFFMEK
jgi:hypothetical protein